MAISYLIFAGLRIANGRLGNDKVETFTFANYNSHSVIDYLLLNEANFKRINDFTIHGFTIWSDNAPLSFSIDYYAVANKSTETRFIYHKWNANYLGEFRKRMIIKLPDFNRLFIDNDNTFSNENVNEVDFVLFSVALRMICSQGRLSSLMNPDLQKHEKMQLGLTTSVETQRAYIMML